MRRLLLKRKLVIAVILLAVLGAFGLWRISKAHCLQLVGDVTCRVETTQKVVALSFDDGPTSEGVDAVLPVLERYDARATFFLIGEHMVRHPGQAERLLAAGHELGNHTWSHQRNIGHLPAFYRAEVEQADAELRRVGAEPTLFRPPFGKRLIGLPLAVEAAGYRMVTWDVEDNPERFADPSAFAQDILARVRPGSIILIHPMYRHSQTAREALPLVLAGLAKQGYQVVTVSELLELGEADERE